jgi:cyanuric acid amidohydrolase
MQYIDVVRIPMSGPGDTSGLERLIGEGRIDPTQIIGIMGKTEGNGCVNDYTREYATASFAGLLARKLDLSPMEVEKRIAFVMSGGTEGVLSPHATVFTRRQVRTKRGEGKRLAVGIAFTRSFQGEEIGRMAQIEETANAIAVAMEDAGIHDAGDVHFVQIKCPLLTSERIEDTRRRGKTLVTEETYESMGYSRGASALGVAMALGEVRREDLSEETVLNDWSRFSAIASTSAGVELSQNVIIVIGNSADSGSDMVIGHSVMRDAIDAAAVRQALHSVGIDPDSQEDLRRVVNVFAKAEASPKGVTRGARHTMLNDSDIHSTRHARAAVGAVVASVVGDTRVYVSGGAEHQGPPGGGPVAVVARVCGHG